MITCSKCGSVDVDLEAGVATCQDCGNAEQLAKWTKCPDCGSRLRTTHSASGYTPEGQAIRTARRQCLSDGCKYTQTVLTAIVSERPKRGQGHLMQLRKLQKGHLEVKVEKKQGPLS